MKSSNCWRQKELLFLVLYALVFYIIVIRRSLHLSHDHYAKLYGLRPGWIAARLNDISDAQWRNFRDRWAYLDNFRGTFRWHICFNFVVLRMISFGCDYHWADQYNQFDQKRHIQRCDHCSSGKTCYLILQERRVTNDKFSFPIYLCYLVYAPLYISGPIISFNAFASQSFFPPLSQLPRSGIIKERVGFSQNIYLSREVTWYGFRWVFSLFLMELMTHLFYYNAFAISGVWKQLSPMDIFIIGYGVLNFMWLKFFLIWRYFRFWSLINGIVPPENMPSLVLSEATITAVSSIRYVYIPLGGSQKKEASFLGVVDMYIFIPEILVKSVANTSQVQGAFREFVFRELSAVAGAITITCLMVANLVGFVIGPSGINWLVSGFLRKEGYGYGYGYGSVENPRNQTVRRHPSPVTRLALNKSCAYAVQETAFSLSYSSPTSPNHLNSQHHIYIYIQIQLIKVLSFIALFWAGDCEYSSSFSPLRNFIFARMMAPSTSSHGLFHGSSIDPFGQTTKSRGTSSIHPLFGTSTPGSPKGASAFASKMLSPFGSTSSGFGGLQGTASNPGIGNECQGSKLASYSETPEVNGTDSRYSIGKIKSISAMPVFRAKSHEELRSEDYKLHKGSTFSIPNQGNAFEQPSSHFCPSTLSVPSSQSSFGSGSGLAFGTATAAPVSNSPVKPPFGSTGRVFGVWLSSGTGGSIGDSNVNQAPRNSASGASSTTIFGAPNNSAIGFNSTPTVLHSSSAHGSTSSIFDVSNVPSFAPGIASSGFSTSIFGFSSTSGFEGLSTSASQVSTTPGVGIRSIPSFWSTSVSLGSSIFGPQSNCASGAPTPSNFSVSTNSAFPFSSASSSGNSNILGIQRSSGSQGATSLESIVGNQYRGSRVAPYSSTREVGGANNWYSVEKIQSSSAMPSYKDKSHEELRSEDYELDGKTPWCQRSSGSDCFKNSDTPADFLSCPPLPPHPSVNSPCHPFKSNPSAPRSQAFITPNSTIFKVPTLYPHVNPITPTKLYPPRSQFFIAQPTAVASMTTSTPNLKPSSVIPFHELMPTNSCQLPAISTTFPSASASMFSSSKPSSTVVTALGPWLSDLDPSQPGQAAEEVDSLSTNNLSLPSQASNGFIMMMDAGSQNVNGQQYVSSSTGGMQSSLVVNPFATRSATDRSNSVTSIQYGISSIPVSDNPSPDRRTSLLRIRHVSLRHSRLPAKRHTCGHREPKVPFFSGKEDRPCPVTPFLPRENPRAWLVNSLSGKEHAHLHSYAEGKGCEDKASPGSSLQLKADDSSAILNLHMDDDSALIEKNEDEVLALIPKLPNGEYYTVPPIEELAAKERAEPGCCSRVNDFIVGRLGYGSIKFLGETDICNLDLESVVQFKNREVVVYADCSFGQSLNKPAEVTLLNIHCISKKTGKKYIDGPQVESYKEMLIKKASEQGAEFVSYDPVQGEWKFRVQSFEPVSVQS
ncbi:UNVERIFIED_CONTAM: Nuclear pore complex protein B [Sesamum radiatum]|uniref:Nuclear pore complex protein B n=1 Tax=Sesamum radiatum TaxID=300843 RepID=A0AAW2RX03_SESRA